MPSPGAASIPSTGSAVGRSPMGPAAAASAGGVGAAAGPLLFCLDRVEPALPWCETGRSALGAEQLQMGISSLGRRLEARAGDVASKLDAPYLVLQDAANEGGQRP
jgi:hypothetical protein